MRTKAIPFVSLLGFILVVLAGFRPNPYLEYVRHIPPPHPYPTEIVVWVGFFIAVQSWIVFAILRPSTYKYSWGRAILGFFVSVGFLGFGALAAMHASPAVSIYILWLFAVAAAMFLLFIWSAISAARSRVGT